MAQSLDYLLWALRPESFLPHSLDLSHADPILVVEQLSALPHHDFLINLKAEIPADFASFARLAEVVIQAPKVLESTRRHFAAYRDSGISVNTHKIT
jgi:DNA polymerase III subunit chi